MSRRNTIKDTSSFEELLSLTKDKQFDVKINAGGVGVQVLGENNNESLSYDLRCNECGRGYSIHFFDNFENQRQVNSLLYNFILKNKENITGNINTKSTYFRIAKCARCRHIETLKQSEKEKEIQAKSLVEQDMQAPSPEPDIIELRNGVITKRVKLKSNERKATPGTGPEEFSWETPKRQITTAPSLDRYDNVNNIIIPYAWDDSFLKAFLGLQGVTTRSSYIKPSSNEGKEESS